MALRTRTRPRRGGIRGFGFAEAARDATMARQATSADIARPMREYSALVPEPQIGPLRFDDFPFQIEWYSEEAANAEEVVWRKSTQVGMSAYAWRWAVRQSDQFGDTGLYIFPTDTHVTEFGDERIEPAIEESPYLRSRVPAGYVRHKRLKRIGRGWLHLRGSNSKAGAQSVAAQFIVFDEYDFLDKSNLPQIERRISGARQIGKHPKIRRLGTPTIEGEGISAAFDASDQRVWIVECTGCGHEQQVTWEDNVRWLMPGDDETIYMAGHDADYGSDPKSVGRVWRACVMCEAELDVKQGWWEPQNPGATVIGYDVTRLIVPNTDLKQIVVASRSSKPMDVEAFENNDLGRAYSPSEAALDQATILAACAMGGDPMLVYQGGMPRTMGVDVAGERDISVRISEQLPAPAPGVPNPRRAIYIGEVKSFEAVCELIERFQPVSIAIDGNPERRLARAVQRAYPGRVVIVEYDDKNNSDAIKITEQGQPGTPLEGVPLKVRVNRTEAIDSMMDSIRQGRNWPLRTPPPKYTDHLRALKRRTVLNTAGTPRRVYVTTGTLGDDYAHAEVYDLVATEMWRMRGGVAFMADPQEHAVTDQEMGFRRVRLDGANADDYTHGFGGA